MLGSGARQLSHNISETGVLKVKETEQCSVDWTKELEGSEWTLKCTMHLSFGDFYVW